MNNKRKLACVADLHIREAGEGQQGRTIEGYALKFGVRSRLLCDWWNLFYEILEPGSVTREMLDRQDIKLTMFHDRQIILARSKQGAGTLSYEVDEVGVRFWAEMPNTEDGDKALELIQRGDIDGCSFIYSTDEGDSVNCVRYEKVTEDGEDVLLRHVLRIDNVYDFTVTPDPAYEQTEVSRREALGDDPEPKPEEKEEKEEKPEAPKIDEERKREAIRLIRDRISRR